MLQLNPKDRGLQGVESTVYSEALVVILLATAVYTENPRAIRQGTIIGAEHPTVAGPAEVLRWEEAEAPDVSDCPDTPAAVACPNRLGAILDHRYAMGLC